MKPQQGSLHVQEHENKDVQSDPPSVIVQDAFNETVKSGADWLPHLVERQSAVREVEGSSPRPDQPTRTNKSARIRTINRRPCLLHLQCYMVSRGR